MGLSGEGGNRQSIPGDAGRAPQGSKGVQSPAQPTPTHLAPELRTQLFLSTAASILPETGGPPRCPATPGTPSATGTPARSQPPLAPPHPTRDLPPPPPPRGSHCSSCREGASERGNREGGGWPGDISPVRPVTVTRQEGTAWDSSKVPPGLASPGEPRLHATGARTRSHGWHPSARDGLARVRATARPAGGGGGGVVRRPCPCGASRCPRSRPGRPAGSYRKQSACQSAFSACRYCPS